MLFYVKNNSDLGFFRFFFSKIDLYRRVFYESDIITFRFTTILSTVTSLTQINVKINFLYFQLIFVEDILA